MLTRHSSILFSVIQHESHVQECFGDFLGLNDLV